jgi:hypothetical protein
MAFKRKQSGDIFKFETKGDSLTGYYLGSQDFQGDFGPTKKHLFKTETGVKIVIGQGYLTNLLTGSDPVAPGTLVRVTFEGTKKGKKGNPMKVYDLEIDADQVLDSAEILDQVDATESEEPDNDFGDEETYVPAPAAAKAQRPTADAIAKMQERLRKTA